MRTSGLTLLEVLVTVTVMSVLVAIAVPSFSDLFDRYRLKGAVDTLYADLQFARSEAVRRNTSLFVGLSAGSGWCYGLDTVDTCRCGTAGDCDMKVVSADQFPSVTLYRTTFSGDSTRFRPRLGDVSKAGTVVFRSERGKEARIVVSPLGRIRRCSPAGSANLWYYPAC